MTTVSSPHYETTTTFPFQHITQLISLKLDDTNFLIWKNQMEPILISTDLIGYVDGSITSPPEFIKDGESEILNPAYFKWRKWDKYVLSCLNSTFSDSLSCSVLGCTTAAEVWSYLTKEFSNQFSARRSMLRGQLQTIKRGARIVAEYVQEVKSISDSLAAINDKVGESDIVMYVLNGLGRDYDNFVISIHNRETPISFADLKAKVLTHEQWLKAQHLETTISLDSITNSLFSLTRPLHLGSTRMHMVLHLGSYDHSTSRHDRPPSQWIDYSNVECQICIRTGHSAGRCPYRYTAFKNNGSQKKSQYNTSTRNPQANSYY
ncbi:hypothetical protein MKW92_042353 [Papaver armeniacum]|nr:hypothetical protein MKW92_042353 [Papaver armeniacum]